MERKASKDEVKYIIIREKKELPLRMKCIIGLQG
jgi:hypothetical protein